MMLIICKSLVTAPSNSELGEALVYCKSYLPLKLTDLHLYECLNFELKIGGKICKILFFYRSPSQKRYWLEKMLENLELSVDHAADKNPYMMVVLGDFNAK